MTFSALQELTADDLNDQYTGIVARIERTSTSSGTTGTTELPVLRGDNIVCKAGRAYRFSFQGVVSSTVNDDGFTTRLRLQTGGSNATTSSTEVARDPRQTLSAQGSAGSSLSYTHCPASDQTVSVLLSLVRTQGTGVLTVQAINNLIQIIVEDLGFAPATSGTAL